jgi:hypothetical protein
MLFSLEFGFTRGPWIGAHNSLFKRPPEAGNCPYFPAPEGKIIKYLKTMSERSARAAQPEADRQ